MSDATKRIPPVFTPETPPGTQTQNRTDLHTAISLATTVQSGDLVLTPKVLGQAKVVATTLTTLYTVPAATATDVTAIYVANQSAVATTFRIAVRVAGLAITDKQYLFFDVAINGSETIILEALGIKLAATDVLSVYATLATISFTAFGVEETARP